MPEKPQTQADEFDLKLAIIEHRANGLVNVNNAAQELADALDLLYAEGGDPEALDAIDRDANELLAHAEQLKQNYHATLELARTAKAALDEVCRAVKDGDRRNPLVDQLLDQVYEEANEDAFGVVQEMYWEDQVYGIEENTGLTFAEASELMDILNGDHNLDPDDAAWDMLRDWIKAAQQSLPHWRQTAAAD